MSEAGTLLENLAGAAPSDGDLVDSIMQELNQPSGGGGNPIIQQHVAIPPPAGARMPQQPQQLPQVNVYPRNADAAPATAHIIGREHPTAADMQQAFSTAAHQPQAFNGLPPQMQGIPTRPPYQDPRDMEQEQPKKNWQGQMVDELKTPIIVALIVFIVTLPAVNVLVSHYAPSLLRPGGDFTTGGMVARALVGGTLFWVLQRVVAPLLSL
jgi:hypothetical protein